MFSISIFGVKTNPAKWARNLGRYFLIRNSPSAHIHLRSAARVLTMFGISGLCAVTLIWIVQNYLLMLWCSHIDYCNFLFVWYCGHLPHQTSCVQNRPARVVMTLPPFMCSVPLLRSLPQLLVKFCVEFKISLLTYKTTRGKQPVYLYSIHLDQTKELVCRSLGSRPS